MNHIVNGGNRVDPSSWMPTPPEARLAEMQMSLWAIRDAISQMGRNIELLLEDRTRPAEPKKYPTEETVQLRLDEENVKNFAEALEVRSGRKPSIPRMELLRRNVQKCGGHKIMKKKFDAGLLRIQAYKCSGENAQQRGHYARINIVDVTLPKLRDGQPKAFGIYCNNPTEYIALLDTLSNILGADFRSRYA